MSGVPLRYAARILAGQSPDSGEVELLDRGLPFLQGNAEFGAQHPTARWESASAPKVAEAGDVLVSVRAPVGAVNLADQRYGIGRGLCAIRPHTGPSRYFYWWLVSSAEELNSVATGSTFAAVSASDLAALLVPVADETQQAQIADYLDRETAEIDAFIADQEELIALLTERRASTISRAVTKGLDLSAPMKDSGVTWLGPIPQSWSVRSAAAVGRAFGSEAVAQDYVVDTGGVPFLKVSSLTADRFTLGRVDSYVSRPRLQAKAGQFIVFPKRGAAIFGNKVNIAEFPAVLDPNLMGWSILEDNVTSFFAYVLKSLRLEEIADVSTVPQINVKHLRALKIPVPPRDEQYAIVLYLDRETAELDAAIADAREAIALSKERRAALISAAVTGKIDVRGAA